MNTPFRSHFPFFSEQPDWVYLDSAATTLKPHILLESTADFYRSAGSVHRSHYDLPQTTAFEQARTRVAQRFHVATDEVIWTSGTTHAINLVAHGLAHQIHAGDEIVISVAEHHANFIPWQQLAERTNAKLIVLPLDEAYHISENALLAALSHKTKLVAFHLVSNVTGIRQPVERLIPLIRQQSNAKILLDIAQAVCTESVNCAAIDADFYTFSAHKMYGPSGVGALLGKKESLAQLRPLSYGGKMLQEISSTQLTLADLPYRLEAGTPNIAGIIGFGEVLAWLAQWDMAALNRPLYQLGEYLYQRLTAIRALHVIGKQPQRTTFSFYLDGIHHADLGAMLTEQHIAIRVGEHCARPYLRYLQTRGTLRMSLAHYNTPQEVERAIKALTHAIELLTE